MWWRKWPFHVHNYMCLYVQSKWKGQIYERVEKTKLRDIGFDIKAIVRGFQKPVYCTCVSHEVWALICCLIIGC